MEREDEFIVENVQKGVRSSFYKAGRFSPTREQGVHHFHSMSDVPSQTPESEAMAKALKKAGFKFVGPTICYAFMQAVGMVNDHLTSCPRYESCLAK